MSTTDSISDLAPPVAAKALRNGIARIARAGLSVCRILFPGRRGNRVRDLNDRQLRDIGLTRDRIDPTNRNYAESARLWRIAGM